MYYYFIVKLPELTPENHEEIYEYFTEFEPNKHIQSLGFYAMHAWSNSDVQYKNSSNETIKTHLANGGSVMLSPNHQCNADTPTVAGLVHSDKDTFGPLKGTTIIPAKAAMFTQPFLGKFIPHMGAHPTFRSKDFSKDEAGQLLQNEVTEDLLKFNIEYLNNGGNIALFSEGTRNKGNPREVQKLKTGIARIALGTNDPSRLLIVTMGIAYKQNKLKRRPNIVVNEPFSPSGMTVEELLENTRTRMQLATTEAFDSIK